MDEVIDDLISLESGFNDGGLDCMEPNIIMQNNVSMKYITSHQYWLTVLTLADMVTYLQLDFRDPLPKLLGPRVSGKGGWVVLTWGQLKLRDESKFIAV